MSRAELEHFQTGAAAAALPSQQESVGEAHSVCMCVGGEWSGVLMVIVLSYRLGERVLISCFLLEGEEIGQRRRDKCGLVTMSVCVYR